MRKMFLALVGCSAVLGLASPAKADVEDCANKLLPTLGADTHPIERAEHRVQVEHEGLRYHWIVVDIKNGRKDITTVIAENDSGYCDFKMVDVGHNISTIEQYEEALTKPIADKFYRAFRENR